MPNPYTITSHRQSIGNFYITEASGRKKLCQKNINYDTGRPKFVDFKCFPVLADGTYGAYGEWGNKYKCEYTVEDTGGAGVPSGFISDHKTTNEGGQGAVELWGDGIAGTSDGSCTTPNCVLSHPWILDQKQSYSFKGEALGSHDWAGNPIDKIDIVMAGTAKVLMKVDTKPPEARPFASWGKTNTWTNKPIVYGFVFEEPTPFPDVFSGLDYAIYQGIKKDLIPYVEGTTNLPEELGPQRTTIKEAFAQANPAVVEALDRIDEINNTPGLLCASFDGSCDSELAINEAIVGDTSSFSPVTLSLLSNDSGNPNIITDSFQPGQKVRLVGNGVDVAVSIIEDPITNIKYIPANSPYGNIDELILNTDGTVTVSGRDAKRAMDAGYELQAESYRRVKKAYYPVKYTGTQAWSRNAEVKVCDMAGNCTTLTDATNGLVLIDKNPPVLGNPTDPTASDITISPDPSDPTTIVTTFSDPNDATNPDPSTDKLEANEAMEMAFSLSDPFATGNNADGHGDVHSGILPDSIKLSIERSEDLVNFIAPPILPETQLNGSLPTGITASLSNLTTDPIKGTSVYFDTDVKINFNDDTDIFEKAGLYKITVKFADQAQKENGETTTVVQYILVVASDLESVSIDDVSSDDPNYGSPKPLANDNSDLSTPNDTQNVYFKLFDRFDNLIGKYQHRGDAIITIYGQNTDGTYNTTLSASAYTAFKNGLRFKNGTISGTNHTLTQTLFISPTTGERLLAMKALVPSLKILSPTVAGQTWYAAIQDPKNITLNFEILDVGPKGQLLTSTKTKSDSHLFNFHPWVNLTLHDKTNGNTSAKVQFNFGALSKIYAWATSTKPLPPLGNKNELVGYLNPGSNPLNPLFKFENEDINSWFQIPSFATETGGKQATVKTHIVSNSEAAVPNDQPLGFASIVDYIYREDGINREIVYPGGSLGSIFSSITPPSGSTINDIIGLNTVDTKAIVIGADIEGDILSSGKGITQLDSAFLGGGVGTYKKESRIIAEDTYTDLRETITRKAYELIRNKDKEANTTLDNINFTNKKVLYYNGNLTLNGGIIDGVGTIIIEDGNLIINGDLTYRNTTDSLGVILINSKQEAKPETGNIFITPIPSKIVGTYFADGSVLSTRDIPSPTVNVSKAILLEERDLDFKKQLVLNGTIFTRNTLGGSMLTIKQTPWNDGQNPLDPAPLDEATLYDLHFIRRYNPPRDGATGDIVADSANSLCTKKSSSSTDCDPNRHAFVIRPDQKVKLLPPPGFTD